MRDFPRLVLSPLFAAALLVAGSALPQAVIAAAAGPLADLRGLLPELSESQARTTADALDAAAAADRETEALEQRLQALRAEAANAPARSRELAAMLTVDRQQAMQEWMARLPADADVETLEAVLERERQAADQLRAQINELTGSIAQGISEPSRASTQLAEQQRRIEELAVPVVAAEGESAELTEARRLRNAAERRRLIAERELRQVQLDLGSSQQRLQELELRSLRYRLSLREPRLALLQQRIAELGRTQLETLAARLAQHVADMPAGDAVAAAAAQQNSELAQEMVFTNERLASQRRIIADDEQLLVRDLAGLRDSRSRVELGGAERAGRHLALGRTAAARAHFQARGKARPGAPQPGGTAPAPDHAERGAARPGRHPRRRGRAARSGARAG